MSLCLIKSGVYLPQRMPINAGPFKGKLIEPGQAALTRVLSKDAYFGAPKKIKYADRYADLKNKQGIISFMQIPGYSIDGALSGHIDLVRNGKFLYLWDTLDCRGACHWDAKELLFWSLA